MKPLYIILAGAVLVGSLAAYAKNDGVGNSTGGHGVGGDGAQEFRSNANPPEASTDPNVKKELNQNDQQQNQGQNNNNQNSNSHNSTNSL